MYPKRHEQSIRETTGYGCLVGIAHSLTCRATCLRPGATFFLLNRWVERCAASPKDAGRCLSWRPALTDDGADKCEPFRGHLVGENRLALGLAEGGKMRAWILVFGADTGVTVCIWLP